MSCIFTKAKRVTDRCWLVADDHLPHGMRRGVVGHGVDIEGAKECIVRPIDQEWVARCIVEKASEGCMIVCHVIEDRALSEIAIVTSECRLELIRVSHKRPLNVS